MRIDIYTHTRARSYVGSARDVDGKRNEVRDRARVKGGKPRAWMERGGGWKRRGRCFP